MSLIGRPDKDLSFYRRYILFLVTPYEDIVLFTSPGRFKNLARHFGCVGLIFELQDFILDRQLRSLGKEVAVSSEVSISYPQDLRSEDTAGIQWPLLLPLAPLMIVVILEALFEVDIKILKVTILTELERSSSTFPLIYTVLTHDTSSRYASLSQALYFARVRPPDLLANPSHANVV